MLRPDFATTAATAIAQETARIALPLGAGSGSGGGSFGALYAEVRNDIAGFVESGSNAAAPRRTTVAPMSAQDTRSAAVGVDRAGQQAFIASIAPWAQQAGERLGVAPELIAAHAALESGWGRQPLRNDDGSSTHNVFGVKTGTQWAGGAASALTTEVEDGVAVRRTDTFRSYATQSDAFGDYAHLLLSNPRYAAALQAGGDASAFARGLVGGNYATDPEYAQKIERVAQRVRELGLPSSTGER